jgi:hypothetical protein
MLELFHITGGWGTQGDRSHGVDTIRCLLTRKGARFAARDDRIRL